MTGREAAGETVAVAEPRLLFFRKFLREGLRVASFAPSSRRLPRATTRGGRRSRLQVIVELGTGTGPVTDCALDCYHPRCCPLAIELDADFAPVLSARCPRATVISAAYGALRGALGFDGRAQAEDRPPTPSASEHAHVAS